MPRWRTAAHAAAALGCAVAVLLWASPASADDGIVDLRDVPDSFRAGGSPGSLSMEVRKTSRGCMLVRTVFEVRMDGLDVDQIKLERRDNGEWRLLPAESDDGRVRAVDEESDDPLCRNRRATLQYRITFLAGVDPGRARFEIEVGGVAGEAIGRERFTSDVERGPVESTPTEAPLPPESPPPQSSPTPAGLVAAGDDGDWLGIGTVVMVLGVLMVAIGAGLLLLLLRRAGRDRDDHPGRGGPPPDSDPTIVLPPIGR